MRDASPFMLPPVLGFCGARIVALEDLPAVGRRGDVVFLGLDIEVARRFGDANPGAASHIRAVTRTMTDCRHPGGPACHDIGVLSALPQAETLRRVMDLTSDLVRGGYRPALIACDHTASLPAVLGAAQGCGSRPVYLYFDAHFDLGWQYTAPSLDNGNFVDALLSSPLIAEVVNLGGRSAMTHMAPDEIPPDFSCIRGRSHDGAVLDAIAALSRLKGRDIYVSIDADVLDRSDAPYVCCPEPCGISGATLLALCQWLGRSCRVIGADLSEILPTPGCGKAEQSLMACLRALFP